MNGPQITLDDFKTLLLDLWLVQRENQQLRAHIEAQAQQGEEVTADDAALVRDA